YCERAVERLGLKLTEADLTAEDAERNLSQWKQVVTFYSLRLILAPLVETVLLLDRLLFLREAAYVVLTDSSQLTSDGFEKLPDYQLCELCPLPCSELNIAAVTAGLFITLFGAHLFKPLVSVQELSQLEAFHGRDRELPFLVLGAVARHASWRQNLNLPRCLILSTAANTTTPTTAVAPITMPKAVAADVAELSTIIVLHNFTKY
ncbi:unnamed protein product, partial [Timema podura]|nr:unnamed protein product [Timema podura]